MAEIKLTRGYVAIVDDSDVEWLSRWKWRAIGRSPRIYAVRDICHPGGRRTTVYMHRQILGEPSGSGDHANRRTLDNRRANLRPCSHAENMRNSTKAIGPSGYRGVIRNGPRGLQWRARICVNHRRLDLGKASSPEQAARLYDAAARQHFGEFAVLNFPEEASV